jgi:hypothetical protein
MDALVDDLHARVGDALRVVGVARSEDELELAYARDDVLDRYGREAIEEMAHDLLAERHLEVGALTSYGVDPPSISGRLYDDFLLVVQWRHGEPVAVTTDRDPTWFAEVVAALEADGAG